MDAGWLGIASFAIAALALLVSFVTLWLTHLRRGTVKMTRPSQFYFGADGSRSTGSAGPPKVFLRAMLYASSKRGRVIDSLWVTLHRGETSQTFNIWVYGDDTLVRGAGLYVPDTGLVTSHHFLLPKGEHFEFRPGRYDVRVFGRVVGDRFPKLLVEQVLDVSEASAAVLATRKSGVYFDYGPNSGTYLVHPDGVSTFAEAFRERARSLDLDRSLPTSVD